MRKIRKDERGVSLIELVIAMSLMGIIGLLCGAIFLGASRAQTDVSNAAAGTGQALTFSENLTRKVRTAQHFKVTSSIRIDIRTATNACEAYVVWNGNIYAKKSSTAVGAFSVTGWRKVLTNVSKINSTDYFTNSSAVGLKYSIAAGAGISHANLVGITTPRVVSATSAPCW